MDTVVSLSDYLERRKAQQPEPVKLPEWRRRRLAEAKDPFIAVKDTSQWRPDPAA